MALAAMLVTLLASSTPAIAHESILYSFGSGTDGASPRGGLIFDNSGNLYGTTISGGTYGYGTVFELSPNSGGGFTEQVLHNFENNGVDGQLPATGLVFDASGNLYGVTQQGGAYDSGTVFELSPQSGGLWSETVLHSFNSRASSGDGWHPEGALLLDSSGNLYGTTVFGGVHNLGAVFELSPQPGGDWSETILHSFGNVRDDGANPFSALIFDSSGNLYGTTVASGSKRYGTVFELSPNSTGGWKETVLYNFIFQSVNGYDPYAGLVFDAIGNLYGTANYGGADNAGVVFELTATASGDWTEKVIHSFNYNYSDGDYPDATLIFDSAGNLYGTTIEGGHYGGGVAFKLTPSGANWKETLLHNFGGDGDGTLISAGLIFGPSGKLYGVTSAGGAFNGGTVFEITRSASVSPAISNGRVGQTLLSVPIHEQASIESIHR